MLSLFVTLASLLSSPAEAAVPAQTSTKVFYVGGYLANPAQMRCWEEGARRNSPGAPGAYEFVGVPYPAGASFTYEGAVNGAAGTIQRIAAEINANPGRRYVIAGHSSGAAISNTIVSRVRDKSHIKQVILDGFTTPRVPEATCWTSRNGNLLSRNYGAMQSCGKGMRVFQDNHCRTAWCLHFSVVVKSTPANLGNDFAQRGYQGCDTNLDWLE